MLLGRDHRAIATAVDAGALTADEVAARWRGTGPAGGGGFLDVSAAGATLPVYVVRQGRAVEARDARDQ